MMTKLRATMLALTIMGVAGFMFWQHERIERLVAERAVVHEQLEQATLERIERQRLAGPNKTGRQAAEADQGELMRLRAQSARLRQVEQENARLKDEHQRLVSQISQAKQADALSEQPQHKLPTPDTKAPTVTLGPDVSNFGVVELSERTPLRLELGEGRECVVTTTVLDDGQLQMVFASESKSPDGVTTQHEATATVPPNRQLIISAVDGAVVSLTPTLKPKL